MPPLICTLPRYTLAPPMFRPPCNVPSLIVSCALSGLGSVPVAAFGVYATRTAQPSLAVTITLPSSVRLPSSIPEVPEPRDSRITSPLPVFSIVPFRIVRPELHQISSTTSPLPNSVCPFRSSTLALILSFTTSVFAPRSTSVSSVTSGTPFVAVSASSSVVA